jgi:2-dehydropantoate 2-reductase
LNARERILVAGTGAMGSLFAAALARGGADVTMAGTWTEAIEAIARRGIEVTDPGGTWTARPSARALAATAASGFPLAIVLVKSGQTAATAPHVARALAPGAMAVTLQNGLGNREALEAVLPGRVAAGVTICGATLLGPGRVRAHHASTVIGASGPLAAPAASLATALRRGGLACEVVDDASPHIWRKLVANCALNPVSAMYRLTNGALLEHPEARALALAAAQEVARVAAARGIALGADPVALTVDVARHTAGNRSSMLQDVEAGRPTEIDALCGAVSALGREAGVATPVNDRLLAAIRAGSGA